MKNSANALLLLALTVLVSCQGDAGINVKDDSGVIIQAVYDSGVGGSSLVLRKNGTYTWLSGLVNPPQQGSYVVRDSVIILNNIKLEGGTKIE
ncbi:hypothetical protein [Hymenobacter elongatus]|uniref:Uncharacterized protein n=1 Tax=Hymenobacter elongatus TaxID=877208 RepID=A0A4Z0PM06_9BACT|nr:hypothetical protein [Hymenobacter elongatus]TGE16438.1 hypothetical protein E5J99_09945 [Hymenobacter elongatus]